MNLSRHWNYKNEYTQTKNIWFINHIPELEKKVVDGVKGKFMSHFKTITSENYRKPTSVNNVYQSEKKLRRLKKQLEGKIFRVIEDRIIIDIKNLFEQEEDYYKPIRVGDFYSNNYIKYESNGNRNQTLLIKEYLDGIKPYLKDIINVSKNLIHGKFNLK